MCPATPEASLKFVSSAKFDGAGPGQRWSSVLAKTLKVHFMPSFSERHGLIAEKSIQFGSMHQALRTSLWNFIDAHFFESEEHHLYEDATLLNFAQILYDRFHKKVVRSLPFEVDEFVAKESEWFENAPWNLIYDYCEFCLGHETTNSTDAEQYQSTFNRVLEREKSGYRLIGRIITPIVDTEQLASIQCALDSSAPFRAAAQHIKTALSLYADRKTPDYRNSVKESISAIESAVKIISGKNEATLGDALKLIDAKKPMHEAFKQALLKLYGYASDAKGVRHALLDETIVDEVDARFMIVTCSAFVTYLIARV
jgi:AbiJ-like protein